MKGWKLGLSALAVAGVLAALGVALGIQIKQGGGSHVDAPDNTSPQGNYLRAVYHPLHFKPAAETANDAQCLACHQDVLDDKPRDKSPAGVPAATSKAWYQRTSTYQGDQDTFHRRHLTGALAKELMNLQCNTCHQGHDPREEAPASSATAPKQSDTDITLRKQVNPEKVCLKCHGQMPTEIMGLPGPWPQHKATFGDSCLTCHSAIRTNRHQVTYLKPGAIEAAGKKDAEVCYGCHGGRAWYRISYPYPRHQWEGMSPEIPEWAKARPSESEVRFQLKTPTNPANNAAKP